MTENLWDDVPAKEAAEQVAQTPEVPVKTVVPALKPETVVQPPKQAVPAPTAETSSKPDPKRWAAFYNRT